MAITESPTVFEDAARALKATRLADAFEAHVRRSAGDELEATHLAALAGMATAELWSDVADLAGLHTPSEQTIGMARAVFVIRARNAGSDPFAGLPA